MTTTVFLSMRDVREEFRFLTLAEAAGILQISKRTILRMIHQRKMPAFKVGGQWRIPEGRFRKWVEHKEKLIYEAE